MVKLIVPPALLVGSLLSLYAAVSVDFARPNHGLTGAIVTIFQGAR